MHRWPIVASEVTDMQSVVVLVSIHTVHTLIWFSFCFQIRVVNAFQEPAATPAQMPFRGRTSLASLSSVAAKLESSKSEPKVGAELKSAETKVEASPTTPPSGDVITPTTKVESPITDNAENAKGETCV